MFLLIGENYEKAIKLVICQIIMTTGFISFGFYKIIKIKYKRKNSSKSTLDKNMNIQMVNLEGGE
jgi:hypothetical protein